MRMDFPGMRISILPVIYIDENNELRLATSDVAGKKLARVYSKVQFWNPWLSTFLWMICPILLGHLNMFIYEDDNTLSIDNTELNILSRRLQFKGKAIYRRFCDNATEANPSKFQGILFKNI